MTLAKCGTASGYVTHRNSKQEACDECREAQKSYMVTYRANNKEKIVTLTKSWNERNPEKVLESSRKYRRNNLEKRRELDVANKHRRRARQFNNGFESYSLMQVIDLYGSVCHICNQEVNLSAPRSCNQKGWESGLHIDHLIPISKGGSDTLQNVRPAHGICNMKKGARLGDEIKIIHSGMATALSISGITR